MHSECNEDFEHDSTYASGRSSEDWMTARVFVLALLVTACGSKTGLPDGEAEPSSAAVPTRTPAEVPPSPGAGGAGGGDGFECPATAPQAGTPCGAPDDRIHQCGRYEVKGCPILASCADGRWHTVDCRNHAEP